MDYNVLLGSKEAMTYEMEMFFLNMKSRLLLNAVWYFTGGMGSGGHNMTPPLLLKWMTMLNPEVFLKCWTRTYLVLLLNAE